MDRGRTILGSQAATALQQPRAALALQTRTAEAERQRLLAASLQTRGANAVGGEREAVLLDAFPPAVQWLPVITDPNFQDAGPNYFEPDPLNLGTTYYWVVDEQAGTWTFGWQGGAFWKNWGGVSWQAYTVADFPQGQQGRFTITVDSIGGIPSPVLYLYNGDIETDSLVITGPGTFSKIMTFDYYDPVTYPDSLWAIHFDDTLGEAYLQTAVVSSLQVEVLG